MDSTIDIEDYVGLIRWIAGRYRPRYGLEYDDYVQEGMIAFVKCIKKFDSSKEIKFSSYLTPYVHGHIKDALRRAKPGGRYIDLEQSIMSIDTTREDEQSLADILEDSSIDIENTVVNSIFCEEIKSILNPRQLFFIEEYYFKDILNMQTCEAVGISESRGSGIRSDALKKLRKKFKY